MEEERARQNRAAEEAASKAAEQGASTENANEGATKEATEDGEDMDVDDPRLLQKALAISMQVLPQNPKQSVLSISLVGDVQVINQNWIAIALLMMR